MATYGEIRAFLKQWAADAPLPLLDGWIQDRYQAILDRLDWDRLKGQATLVTAASYATGTIALTNGSTTVTGTGTTFTSAMTGRLFRVSGESQYYTFTYVSSTSGTLDRAYQGETASGLSYRIDKNLFQAPSDARIIDTLRCLDPERELHRMSIEDADSNFPGRNVYGAPLHYVIHMDSVTTPPRIQTELLPIPDSVTTIGLWYDYEPSIPNATSTSILPWMRPAAIKAGVQADICLWRKDYSGAVAHEGRCESAVQDMIRTACFQRGAVSLKTSLWMHRHQARRHDR